MPACNDQLRQLRLEAGLSKSKLAQAADMDRGTVSHAENGNSVSEVTIPRLAKALSIKLGRKVEANEITA
jgi:transcriptional regulator with XRE-family HTH domain